MTRHLTVSEVIEINKRMIIMYSETEQIGVKDIGLLESAVYRPQHTVYGEDAYGNIYDKATALFESLAKNHAFHNGNKRTALTSLSVFLHLNGIKFTMIQKEVEDLVVNFVNGIYGFEEVSRIIEINSN